MNNKALTLTELNSLVADAVAFGVPGEYVVTAELAGVRLSRGHCYMELVEKDPRMNTPIARANAKCWRSTWQILAPAFTRVTGQELHAGMKVMLTVEADFHVAYGFSWTVVDISAEYSLGEMALRRRQIIECLKQEGVFDLQHELALPRFCQRIALISAEGAAGYGDFENQLSQNDYGLAFKATLFPAIVQGEQVESSVTKALMRIYKSIDSFDCVVIIRGGGATSDLAGFDTLSLAEHIANFPLPILTGIGHERDESVADMVACIALKTPTAVAAFLIDHLRETADFVDDAAEKMRHYSQMRLEAEHNRLAQISTLLPVQAERMMAQKRREIDTIARQLPMLARDISQEKRKQLLSIAKRMPAAARQLLQEHASRLDRIAQKLPSAATLRLGREQHKLELLYTRAMALDPRQTLRRGFAIVSHNGHALTSTEGIALGDKINIRLYDGKATAIVESKQHDAPDNTDNK